MQAEVSDAERLYIAQGVAQDLRNDGRGCRDLRPLELELGVIAAANGSSRLHVGATDVIAGVKVCAARVSQRVGWGTDKAEWQTVGDHHRCTATPQGAASQLARLFCKALLRRLWDDAAAGVAGAAGGGRARQGAGVCVGGVLLMCVT
jgi:exosome complex RNA-binding protein Rrp42 (RNase PH superfamily)